MYFFRTGFPEIPLKKLVANTLTSTHPFPFSLDNYNSNNNSIKFNLIWDPGASAGLREIIHENLKVRIPKSEDPACYSFIVARLNHRPTGQVRLGASSASGFRVLAGFVQEDGEG